MTTLKGLFDSNKLSENQKKCIAHKFKVLVKTKLSDDDPVTDFQTAIASLGAVCFRLELIEDIYKIIDYHTGSIFYKPEELKELKINLLSCKGTLIKMAMAFKERDLEVCQQQQK